MVPEWWHYAGAAGPITAALVVTSVTEGRAGLRQLADQFHPGRATPGWLGFARLSPIALFVLGAVVARVVEGSWPAYDTVAKTSNLPSLGLPVTFLVHLLTFGLGEETGWRGFGLPRLWSRCPALRATMVLAAGWGIWHIPSFFENPGYQTVNLAGWSVGLVLGAVFLTWLYNSTNGSLFAVVLWHGVFNTLVASEAAEGLIAAVMTTDVTALAIVALVVAGPAELRGLPRITGLRERRP